MNPSLENDLEIVTSSIGYKSISSLCKILGRIVHLACDSYTSSSKRPLAWMVLANVSKMVNELVAQVESDWVASMFAHVQDPQQIGK